MRKIGFLHPICSTYPLHVAGGCYVRKPLRRLGCSNCSGLACARPCTRRLIIIFHQSSIARIPATPATPATYMINKGKVCSSMVLHRFFSCYALDLKEKAV